MKVYILSSLSCLLFLLGLTPFCFGQKVGLAPEAIVIEKNYAVLAFLYQNKNLKEQLSRFEQFETLQNSREQHYSASLTCESWQCYIDSWKWQEGEIDHAVRIFDQFYESNPEAFESLFKKNYFPFQYESEDGDTKKSYLLNALRADLDGLNWAIDVYGGGVKPNYPKIDSISYDVNSKRFTAVLKTLGQNIERELRVDSAYFFQPLLTAMRLLEINERFDAAILEPLEEHENRAAVEYIQTLDFNKFPYSATVTLGAGPAVYGQQITDIGMLNCREAARLYKQGTVPLIIVSGGRVHPYKTKIVEALEMKKYLMKVLNVPERAIVIDPHARHTTTNIRNASRLMLKYGVPDSKLALINSTESHIDAVVIINKRFMRELGFLPVAFGKRVDEMLMEFRPLKDSFRIDHEELLDP